MQGSLVEKHVQTLSGDGLAHSQDLREGQRWRAEDRLLRQGTLEDGQVWFLQILN